VHLPDLTCVVNSKDIEKKLTKSRLRQTIFKEIYTLDTERYRMPAMYQVLTTCPWWTGQVLQIVFPKLPAIFTMKREAQSLRSQAGRKSTRPDNYSRPKHSYLESGSSRNDSQRDNTSAVIFMLTWVQKSCICREGDAQQCSRMKFLRCLHRISEGS
jgi:hypothetical protein